ncbi:hypothetical protein Q7C36_002578 [Tachysurus vachellii]|uniref:Uncharacterized protein n=1 Tax=Tachysurus vachellii TaxID=175792 RepID=A0AA88T6J5_TACVA|nr:hypothetical protein Q7C36_002578 [Tachysurus vachellii]
MSVDVKSCRSKPQAARRIPWSGQGDGDWARLVSSNELRAMRMQLVLHQQSHKRTVSYCKKVCDQAKSCSASAYPAEVSISELEGSQPAVMTPRWMKRGGKGVIGTWWGQVSSLAVER